MATIKAFRAYRPVPELISKVAALPYDVVDREQAKKIARGNEFSFLHVDKPEIDLNINIDPYDKKVYEKARENLNDLIQKGVYIQDEKDCLYIYRLTRMGKTQTGLVCCTSIDDYINDVIKKHENTLEQKEQDRINHVKYTEAHTGPILTAFRGEMQIADIMKNWCDAHEPVYDWEDAEGIHQSVWVLDDEKVINDLTDLFSEVHALYIADGHHRAAAATKVGLMKRKENPNYNGQEEFNYYLSVIFADSELVILEYNRLVSDLNGLSKESFLERLKKDFELSLQAGPYRPTVKHSFGIYLSGKWYSLTAKDGIFDENDPVERLDVSILHNKIIAPILGITNPRSDSRIDYVGGGKGLEELISRVDSGEMKVAFSMYPTSMEDLMSVADAGRIMPPKSTWFEPKLRSGIFIHSIK